MSSFATKGNDEAGDDDDSLPLLSQSHGLTTLAHFTSYVSSLRSALESSMPELLSLPTPDSKRLHILDVQKDVMTSFAPSWEVGRSSLAALISCNPKTSDTYKEMNDLLSQTYLTSVLSGTPPSPPRSSGDLTRPEILTFLDITTSYVLSPPVSSSMKAAYNSTPERRSSVRAMNEALVSAQRRAMSALGYDPDWATGRLQVARDRFSDDEEVQGKLNAFVDAMVKRSRDVAAECDGESGQATTEVLDDGRTRVTKVTHTEVGQGEDTVAPSSLAGQMGERGPSREEVAKMKQMAVMEQDVLAELLSLDDAEIAAKIAQCRAVQSSFLQQVSALPQEERAGFMLCVSGEVKRALIMVRVWEDFEAKRGGKQLVRAKGNEM